MVSNKYPYIESNLCDKLLILPGRVKICLSPLAGEIDDFRVFYRPR